MNLEILCTPYTDDVDKWLNKNISFYGQKKILHIVPTLILYRKRLQSYRNQHKELFQNNETDFRTVAKTLEQRGIFLYEMDRFLLKLIKTGPYTVLSKRESAVLIGRVLENHSFSNNIAWKSSLQDISECFITLSQSGLSLEEIRALDATQSWELVCDLYENYLAELSQQGVLDYGQACVRLLQEYNFESFDMLLLDGAFLPILPKHQMLINRFQKLDKKIICFIPIDLDFPNNPAFEAVKTTYVNFAPMTEWKSIKSEQIAHSTVRQLAQSIFHSKVNEISDRSVTVLRFVSEEEELDYIVERAGKLIEQGAAKPHEIALITPNPMELRPTVRELAEIYGIAMEVPERSLIHLPHGRAVFNLLKIHTDDRIEVLELPHFIDINMVLELIEGDLIQIPDKAVFQCIVDLQAFFEDCKTFPDWFNKIDELIAAKDQINDDYTSHPLYYISKDTLINVKNIIEIIATISSDLMSASDMTFTEHLDHIVRYFEESPYTNEIEEEIKERLSEIVEELTLHNHLAITRSEFARRIYAVLNDKQHEKENDQRKVRLSKVLVTGPNNVEYQKYEYVFITRFNQHMYPERIAYAWPMSADIERKILNTATVQKFSNEISLLRYYADRSVYYIYTALQAAKKSVFICYSRFEDGIKLSPSHYLYDIAKALGIGETDDDLSSIENLLEKEGQLFDAGRLSDAQVFPFYEQNLPPMSKDKIITIEDVAVYQLCPRRFYYEKNLEHEYVYSSAFHLQNYAVSFLYEKAVVLLVNQFPEVSKENMHTITHALPNIIAHAEKELKTAFPMAQRYWEDVKMRVHFHLQRLLNQILSNPDYNRASLSITQQRQESKIKGYTFVGERQLRVSYQTITHYYSITNMRKILSFSANETRDEQQKLDQVKKDYFDLLSRFCRKERAAEQSLSYYAQQIESGHFSKKAGAHCRYCAFENACKEKGVG